MTPAYLKLLRNNLRYDIGVYWNASGLVRSKIESRINEIEKVVADLAQSEE